MTSQLCKRNLSSLTCVCCFVSLNQYWGTVYGRCVSSKALSSLFVCLFVGMKPEKYTPPPVGREAALREVTPLGVVTHGQRHKPRRAYQRQRHNCPGPRTCQSMVNTLAHIFKKIWHTFSKKNWYTFSKNLSSIFKKT